MEEKLQILERWVATGQVKTARGRSHDDLLTLIGQMKVALRQPLVSGSLPCHHNFIQKDTYWKSCTHCGMLAPLGQ